MHTSVVYTSHQSTYTFFKPTVVFLFCFFCRFNCHKEACICLFSFRSFRIFGHHGPGVCTTAVDEFWLTITEERIGIARFITVKKCNFSLYNCMSQIGMIRDVFGFGCLPKLPHNPNDRLLMAVGQTRFWDQTSSGSKGMLSNRDGRVVKVSEKMTTDALKLYTVTKGSRYRHHSEDETWRHHMLRKNMGNIINKHRLITLHGWTTCLHKQVMNTWALCSCWGAIKSARHPMDFLPQIGWMFKPRTVSWCVKIEI